VLWGSYDRDEGTDRSAGKRSYLFDILCRKKPRISVLVFRLSGKVPDPNFLPRFFFPMSLDLARAYRDLQLRHEKVNVSRSFGRSNLKDKLMLYARRFVDKALDRIIAISDSVNIVNAKTIFQCVNLRRSTGAR